jgi:hypothetical protein
VSLKGGYNRDQEGKEDQDEDEDEDEDEGKDEDEDEKDDAGDTFGALPLLSALPSKPTGQGKTRRRTTLMNLHAKSKLNSALNGGSSAGLGEDGASGLGATHGGGKDGGSEVEGPLGGGNRVNSRGTGDSTKVQSQSENKFEAENAHCHDEHDQVRVVSVECSQQ